MSVATNKIGTGFKTVGTGLKMVGGADVPSYTLEFLTNSKKHLANTNQTIVVPYIEIGRDSDCVINFGDDLPMVSRKHAAIERRGQEVFLKQLSQTNQTLINGRPVNKEWYLENGDEIQLSPSGPRVRYLTTTTKTSTMGISKRMQLFAQQSLRPYRQALITLLLLFVASGVVAAYLIYNLSSENRQLQMAYSKIGKQTEEQQKAIERGDSIFLAKQKELAEKLATENKKNTDLIKQVKNLQTSLEKIQKTPPQPPAKITPDPSNTKKELSIMIEDVRKYVYFIKMYLTIEGEVDKAYIGSGTGFLLDNGKFVTARHCVQPWAFANPDDQDDEQLVLINWLYYNSPEGAIKLDLEITDPEGKTIYLPGENFIINDSKDLQYTDIDLGYGPGKLQFASLNNGMDWAYYEFKSSKLSGISSDPVIASGLKTGTTLHILGYTYGLGNSGPTPSPFYSAANVSQSGLMDGLINVTNLGFAQGNSGGPVFIEKEGQLINVGLVSAGTGSVLGMIVPISALKK